MSKVLFILKRREDYGYTPYSTLDGLSTGLYNSASFMRDMLLDAGIDAKMEVVIDNNDIDKVVTEYQPTHVIIEALWVVPTKFDILQKLHPNVKWIVRLHSELPFLAGEGIAMDWVADYCSYKNVSIGINAPRMMQEVYYYISSKYGEAYADQKLIYMPNFYPQQYVKKEMDRTKSVIDIGCFGALRPLKNHMIQAIAAIRFAEEQGKTVRFHINSGRNEMKGEPVEKNIRDTFAQLLEQGHELVNHDWTPREEFLKLCATMDIGMVVSFSETFCIVAADLVSQGVPIVSSREIPWASCLFNAEPTETDDIINKLHRAYMLPSINTWLNQHKLNRYTNKTRNTWVNYFKGE